MRLPSVFPSIRRAGMALADALLKRGVAEALDEVISPIRNHFEKDPSARRLFEVVRTAETTR